MKNQYFGDNHDLFKYDLITEIMKNIPALRQFTFIPMLTPNDDRNDGNDRDVGKARAGFLNNDLVKFLEPIHRVRKVERDFTKISEYFEKKGIRIKIYDGQAGNYFSSKKRKEYFNNIEKESLTDSFVFIDPDNGLQVNTCSEKHVLNSEISGLFDKAKGSKTVVMVIQFFPHESHIPYIRRRLLKLSKISSYCSCIADNRTAFFILTGDRLQGVNIIDVLRTFKEKYKKLIVM